MYVFSNFIIKEQKAWKSLIAETICRFPRKFLQKIDLHKNVYVIFKIFRLNSFYYNRVNDSGWKYLLNQAQSV